MTDDTRPSSPAVRMAWLEFIRTRAAGDLTVLPPAADSPSGRLDLDERPER